MKNPIDAGGCLSVGKTWECCGGSTAREVRKDVFGGWKSVGSPEGYSCHELRLGGIFIPNISDTYLWHCRLGHMNKNRIDRLIKEAILKINDCESLPTCESYLLGKMAK